MVVGNLRARHVAGHDPAAQRDACAKRPNNAMRSFTAHRCLCNLVWILESADPRSLCVRCGEQASHSLALHGMRFFAPSATSQDFTSRIRMTHRSARPYAFGWKSVAERCSNIRSAASTCAGASGTKRRCPPVRGATGALGGFRVSGVGTKLRGFFRRAGDDNEESAGRSGRRG